MKTSTTDQTLDLVKGALAQPGEELQKAYTVGTGLTAYDLQPAALSMFPVLTPLRNRIPRVSGRGGTGANWKAITGINTGNISPGVSEGNRNAAIETTLSSYLAEYKGIGLEDSVTYEAEYAAEGFDNARARAVTNLLRATMVAEERVIFGGNTSMNLGTTPTPAVATSTSGGSIAASTTVSVICVALTHAGYRRATVASGVVASISRTNADSSSDTMGGGAAQRSAAATVATGVSGAAHSVSATVAPVYGAVAYAWYAGTAGAERIVAITTINSVVITALPGSGQLASALPSADNSTDSLVFDGVLTFASKSNSNGYRAQLATGTAGTGTPLTSDGAGGIVEVTTALGWFWDNYRLSPDELLVSAQELQNITKKVVANGGVPLLRATTDAERRAGITAGFVVDMILNPITQTFVAVRVHPEAVAGTMVFTTSEIPYPTNGVVNVMQIKTRKDYYQVEWPARTRKYEFGVYADEVLQHYAPFTLGVITNIGNG